MRRLGSNTTTTTRKRSVRKVGNQEERKADTGDCGQEAGAAEESRQSGLAR